MIPDMKFSRFSVVMSKLLYFLMTVVIVIVIVIVIVTVIVIVIVIIIVIDSTFCFQSCSPF